MTNNIKQIYSILKKEQDQDRFKYLIRIDFSHPIFQGHFPNKTVLPGVVMCDIIRHLSSDKLGIKVQLILAKNIKFMKMITPSKNNTYNVTLSIIEVKKRYKIRAIISQNEKAYFKLNGEYKRK